MQIRDRIKELRRVRAGELRPHPHNWRTHPDASGKRCGAFWKKSVTPTPSWPANCPTAAWS